MRLQQKTCHVLSIVAGKCPAVTRNSGLQTPVTSKAVPVIRRFKKYGLVFGARDVLKKHSHPPEGGVRVLLTTFLNTEIL